MDIHRVQIAVMHFVTQFTQVYELHEFTVKKRQMLRKNCFENLVSNLCKNGLCVHKTTLEKSAKTKKKKKTKNHESAQNL